MEIATMETGFVFPEHGQVIDINGSKMSMNLKAAVEKEFLYIKKGGEKPTMPDELLYTDIGLNLWKDIIHHESFYQTHDEAKLFDINGAEIVSRLRPGVVMIDLGAGDTEKVEHLLAAFEKARVPCTYLALDISKKSLDENIKFLESKHSGPDCVVRCAGLWGTFEDGKHWVQNIQGQRLFLSLGSVLCNDPYFEALTKLKSWASVMREDDLTLIGMDGHLHPKDEKKIWKAYHSTDDLYRKFFFDNGFAHANKAVGETWFREQDWELKAELEDYPTTRHRFYFRARHTFNLGSTDRQIQEGEEFDWFDSHKYGQSQVETMFEKSGLIATNIWQAPDSEFRQYLVKLKDDHDQRGDADSAVSGVN
ncbi:unnamed protein product [Clonostachys byssicola]|uniref:4-dimethylallyltryptophan N-methyltransferase n=1 Tax=Clonostachys byssicola TaxID=160290 RepID=A0A9N9UQD8_9HYPO|nr:unnamed protein product [Clonostachys byssicola]